MPLKPDESEVAGRFEILEPVGQGGMGTVYKARDRRRRALVALKIVEPRDEKSAQRFVQEALLLGELDDPRIVRYLAHGFTASGALYLAMEWLEGEPLSARLERGPLSVGESVALAREVAAALAVAHARGIVHRDIKPSNVFLAAPGGQVKLLDFGVARWANQGQDLTQTGDRVGTPLYMAPEQVKSARNIEASADVWSLGCLLYQCVAGRSPFVSEHVTTALARILYEPAPRLSAAVPGAPAELDELVARMLEREPERRPADGAETVAALDQLLAGVPVADRPAPEVLGGGELRLHTIVVIESRPASSDELSTVDTDPGTPLLQVVQPYGGRVDQLPNGAAVVRFVHHDVPTVRVRKAAQCALALRAVLSGSAIAVVTGRGPAGALAAVGEVVDRALERLVQPAAGIVIDELTAQLLDSSFDVVRDANGPLLRWLRDAEPRRALLGRPTTFVGRERDLATLLDVAEHSASEPAARVVLVTGASGLGKSRLADELAQRLADRRVWSARGDAVRAGTPLLMLAELLHRALGLDEVGEAERPRVLRERVAAVIEEREVDRVAGFLGELVGLSAPVDSLLLQAAHLDATIMSEQLRHAWLDWLGGVLDRGASPLVGQSPTSLPQRASPLVGQSPTSLPGAGPLLLVLDDLQWGDAETIKLIDDALRAHRDRPLMVLALAQPQVVDLHPRLWQERGLYHLALRELAPRAAAQLVADALGAEASPAMTERVIERSGGNAFFLEELIRAVVGGREELPETILAVAQARLAKLSASTRRLLRAASVFGVGFPAGGVAALVVSGGAPAELQRPLAEALDREVIVRRQPGDEYSFRHSYLREAAYATLTGEDRVRGHRLAGRWLAERGDADSAAVHWTAAGAFDALADLIRAQAMPLAQKGHFATLRDLLARLPDEVKEADPWLLYWSGVAASPADPIAGRAPLERAYAGFLAAGDPAGAFLAWSGVVDSWFFDPLLVTPVDRWYDELARLRERWPVFPGPAIEARVAATLFAAAGRRHPRNLRLEEWTGRAWALLEQEGTGALLAFGLVLHLLVRGEPADARRVITTVRPRIPPGSLAALYVDAAECYLLWQECELGQAEALAWSGQRAAEAVGLHALAFQFLAVRVNIALNRGDQAAARAHFESLDARVPPGHRMARAHLDFCGALERLVAGDIAAAVELGARSTQNASDAGASSGLAVSRMVYAEALIEAGELDAAREQIDRVAEYAAASQSRQLDLLAALGRAHLADRAGHEAERDAELATAFAIARATGVTLAAWSATHETMRRLIGVAVARGIEVELVTGLARKQGLL